MKYKLSIIIPARNEELTIEKTCQRLKKVVKVLNEILVIVDSRDDLTYDAVNKISQKDKSIKVFINNFGRGFTNAIKTGFNVSSSPCVVIVMADLCDDPKTINEMYRESNKGWDIVCGSRYMKKGGKEGGPLMQGCFSFLTCFTLHLLTGIPTLDVSNAFKMYKSNVLKNVVFNSQSGVEGSMELTLQAYFKGARIKDVPTVWEGRTIGQSKFKFFERAPRYWRIYSWAVNNTIRKILRLPIKDFYALSN